jgi:hypothetical protein
VDKSLTAEAIQTLGRTCKAHGFYLVTRWYTDSADWWEVTTSRYDGCKGTFAVVSAYVEGYTSAVARGRARLKTLKTDFDKAIDDVWPDFSWSEEPK